MSIAAVLITTLTYAFVWWLGLYLIARNPASLQLRFAGLGLLFYAFALAGDVLANQATSPELALILTRLSWPLLFLPALFWFGAVVGRLPEPMPLHYRLQTTLHRILIPIAIPFYAISAATNLIFDFNQSPPQPGPAYILFALAVLLPMLAACILAFRIFRLAESKNPVGLLLLATLFFGLSAVLLVSPFNWLPRVWFLLGVSLDFIILGLVIALLDAFDEGETLLPHFLRSLAASVFVAILFGGLVVLTMALSTGLTFAMLGLLFITLTAAILTQTFTDPIQTFLDNLTLSEFPRLRRARADLRNLASVLPRVNESFELEKLDEEEFARLTRRALSQMGNLPRMAGNPLTRLPLIDERLAKRDAGDNTLERAAELKRLLTESITRLKPPDKGDFGTSEEWRFYNALYFPYVVGLRPYSRRIEHDGLNDAAQEALEWFRTYIPERTLYNWQNAAAKLVAQDLRERMN